MQVEWGGELIRAWNSAGWMTAPARIGDRIGRLIGCGARHGGDGRYAVDQGVSGAGRRPGAGTGTQGDPVGRRQLPTDLYMAQGLAQTLGNDVRVKVVAPETVAEAIDETVAVLMLTEVDYRTGRRHDMAELTRRAHAAGAITVWDLAHSAGAIPWTLRVPTPTSRWAALTSISMAGGCAGLHLCRAAACGDGAARPLGLDGTCIALRLRSRLQGRARHRAHARGHAADPGVRGARCGAGRVGRRGDGGRAGARRSRCPSASSRKWRRGARS